MRLPDFWTGLLFAAFGVAIAGYATTFRVPAGAASPQLFPIAIGTIMAISGALVAFRGLRDMRSLERPEWFSSPRRIALVCYIPIAVVIFVFLSSVAGTILTATFLVTVHAFLYGLRPFSALAIGVVSGVGIPLVFVNVLNVSLPSGLIEGLF